MKRLLPALCAVALLAVAPPVASAADDTPPASDAAKSEPGKREPGNREPGTEGAAPRVRASHRVDVIGPGEKVETVIERFRAGRVQSPRDPSGSSRAPQGADGSHRGAEHGGGEARGMTPPPGASSSHDMMPPPGTSPPSTASPAPGRGEHRPDRSHR